MCDLILLKVKKPFVNPLYKIDKRLFLFNSQIFINYIKRTLLLLYVL